MNNELNCDGRDTTAERRLKLSVESCWVQQIDGWSVWCTTTLFGTAETVKMCFDPVK